MKLLPMLLTNLLCVGVGIGAYDLIKGDDQARADSTADVNLIEGSNLEARIAKLEAAAPSGPLLTGTDAPALTQADVVDIVKRHVKQVASQGGGEVIVSGGESTTVERAVSLPASVKSEDMTAFRTLLEEVEKQRRAEREEERAKATEARMMARLDRLDIGLNDNQKAEILKISQDHRQKMRDTFSKLRESGAGREEYRAAITPLREELKTAVENVVPGEDAAKVVQTLGGGMRGDRGGRGGGRNRNRN